MARIRTIKPQHVNDKELPKISLQAHLFWVLSWCFSDDEGVIENDPLLLKSQMFPRRKDVKVEHIEQWIEQLISAKFVLPFTYEGDNYLIQRTFKIHQKVDRPQGSKIPDAIIRRTLDEYSTTQQPCIVKDSKGEDSKGEKPEEEKILLPHSDLFKNAWNDWIKYRKEIKKPLTESAIKKQLELLSSKKEAEAIGMLNQSIQNQWQGLFELKNQPQQPNTERINLFEGRKILTPNH